MIQMATGPKSIKEAIENNKAAIDEHKEAIENNKAAIDEHTKRLNFHRRWIGRLTSYESTVKKNVLGVADNKKLLEEMKIEEEKTFGNVKETKSLLEKHVEWTTDMFERRKQWVQKFIKNCQNRFDNIQENFVKVQNFMDRTERNGDVIDNNFENVSRRFSRRDERDKNQLSFLIEFLADKYPEFKGKWVENAKKLKLQRSEKVALEGLLKIGKPGNMVDAPNPTNIKF